MRLGLEQKVVEAMAAAEVVAEAAMAAAAEVAAEAAMAAAAGAEDRTQ
jgi:hypothetical protein